MKTRRAIAAAVAGLVLLGLILRPFGGSMTLVFAVLALVAAVVARDALVPDR